MSNLLSKIKLAFSLVFKGQFGFVARAVRNRFSSSHFAFGLKRDLTIPFSSPISDIDLSIRLYKTSDAKYFEMANTNKGLLAQNIPYCYVAINSNNEPCFMQWLIDYTQNDKIQDYFGNIFPLLKEDEALLEGAYVQPKNRGKHIMQAGIYKIIDNCNHKNARYIITFVEIHNIPSLRACSHSGFYPYTLRIEKWFLFNKKTTFVDIPKNLMKQYLKDVEDKPKPMTNTLHLA